MNSSAQPRTVLVYIVKMRNNTAIYASVNIVLLRESVALHICEYIITENDLKCDYLELL